MTKLQESSQGGNSFETNIFKCWCGEHSYLDVTKDLEDGDIFISITQDPTRLLERLKMAYKALRGIEFTSSNCVIVARQDINKLIDALLTNNKEE